MTDDATRSVDLRQHAEEIAQAGARAPSHHNAQPWAFRVLPGAVEVHADRSRRLPVADPEDRQLFVGVGAAVYGVRLALAVLGLRPVVRLARDDARPDLAATVMASGQADPARPAEWAHSADPAADSAADSAEARRHRELGHRQTVRGPFTDEPLPSSLQAELASEVDEEGAIGRTKWDAPEIDGAAFLNGATGLQAGDIVRARVVHADEYDVWGEAVEVS